MNLRQTLAVSAILIAGLAATGAQASTLLNDTSAPFARTTDTSFNETFGSLAAGLANLSFEINGFGSLDGQNFYEDDFTLSLNGLAIMSGTFNLGGGGADAVYLAPSGATATNVSGNGAAVTWTGGQVNVATPLTLLAGSNTLTFGYHSLTIGHAGFQGLADEGWDASNVVVTQTSRISLDAIAVPEPASWALMIGGFGGIGVLIRRRREGLAAS